jgi:hypothetical protein
MAYRPARSSAVHAHSLHHAQLACAPLLRLLASTPCDEPPNSLTLIRLAGPCMLQQRLPSGMQGHKNTFESDGSSGAGMEGSLRNHLAVWGPGVPSGGVSNTLLSLADVLPTIAELADATNTKHEPWVRTGITLSSCIVLILYCIMVVNRLAVTPCSGVQHTSTPWMVMFTQTALFEPETPSRRTCMPACCTGCTLLQLPPACFKQGQPA